MFFCQQDDVAKSDVAKIISKRAACGATSILSKEPPLPSNSETQFHLFSSNKLCDRCNNDLEYFAQQNPCVMINKEIIITSITLWHQTCAHCFHTVQYNGREHALFKIDDRRLWTYEIGREFWSMLGGMFKFCFVQICHSKMN